MKLLNITGALLIAGLTVPVLAADSTSTYETDRTNSTSVEKANSMTTHSKAAVPGSTTDSTMDAQRSAANQWASESSSSSSSSSADSD